MSSQRKKRPMPFHRERLAEIRNEYGLTQEELAKRVDISKSQIGRYETGVNEPSASVLSRIAKELNVSTDWLCGLVDERTARMPDVDDEDRDFIKRFRSLPKDIRDLIMGLVFRH